MKTTTTTTTKEYDSAGHLLSTIEVITTVVIEE